MNIKRTSWHYKLHNFWDEGRVPRDMTLCGYFWKTVWLLVCSITIIVVAPLIASLLLVAVAGIALTLVGIQPPDPTTLAGFFTCIVVGAVACLVVTGAVAAFIKLKGKPHAKELSTNWKEREPSLLEKYLKARKDKYCPLIEFIDE